MLARLQCRLLDDHRSEEPGSGHGDGQGVLALCSVVGMSCKKKPSKSSS